MRFVKNDLVGICLESSNEDVIHCIARVMMYKMNL